MNDLRSATKAFKSWNARLEPVRIVSTGELVAHDGSVAVTNRPGYSWCRDGDHVFQILNVKVRSQAGVRVLLGYAPGSPYEWQVLGIDTSLLAGSSGWDGDPYLVSHGYTHEIRDGELSPDPVYVYARALMPGRTGAPATGGLGVAVAPLIYEHAGQVVTFPGSSFVDVSACQPAVGLACWVLVYVDRETNGVGVLVGEAAMDNDVLLPTPPLLSEGIPSAWVLLRGGETDILESDIYDARLWLGALSGSGSTRSSRSTLPQCWVSKR